MLISRSKEDLKNWVNDLELKVLFSIIPDIATLNLFISDFNAELKITDPQNLPPSLRIKRIFKHNLVNKMDFSDVITMFELKDLFFDVDAFANITDEAQDSVLNEIKLYYLRLAANNFQYNKKL